MQGLQIFMYEYFAKQQGFLEKAEYAFRHQKIWLQIREKLEAQILKLQQEIDLELFKKLQARNLEQASKEFHIALETKRDLISKLRKEQQQVDELLDQIEHLNEESLHQLRFHLLHMTWQVYPEKRTEQESKWEEWNHLRALEIEIVSIEEVLKRLAEHVTIARKTRLSIKGKGILNYIFGTSPNSIIEQQLMGMKHLIESSASLFEKVLQYSRSPSLSLLIENLLTWLEKVKVNCSKSWNFKHLDGLFLETAPLLNQYILYIREEQKLLRSSIQALNQEIQNWFANCAQQQPRS